MVSRHSKRTLMMIMTDDNDNQNFNLYIINNSLVCKVKTKQKTYCKKSQISVRPISTVKIQQKIRIFFKHVDQYKPVLHQLPEHINLTFSTNSPIIFLVYIQIQIQDLFNDYKYHKNLEICNILYINAFCVEILTQELQKKSCIRDQCEITLTLLQQNYSKFLLSKYLEKTHWRKSGFKSPISLTVVAKIWRNTQKHHRYSVHRHIFFSSSSIRSAMMAMTTNNSMSVKPP
eukprot:TRINITY_DN23506_c1_g1_i1.p1 TRINITY_DN23506_c1_g1~~TRINITY_DN23506_c1_g1_i1.p1  ORF type:complete len:231 (+),score=-16.69 TRINITY_DN23506_c1_g1_i1:360-1052(+)